MANQYWYEMVDTAAKPGRLFQIGAAATRFSRETLAIKPGEQVCIVTDTEISPLVYYSIAGAIRGDGGTVSITVMEPLAVPSAEPPPAVAAAMKSCDILINCCSRSISHSKACHVARLEHKVRYVVMSNVTEDMLVSGAARADVDIVRDISIKTRDALNKGTSIHLTSPKGTDVTFDMTGRNFSAYYSRFENGARTIVYPGGEVNTTPQEHSGNGRIVLDAFMMEVGLLREPIIWDLKDGKIVSISGGAEARALERILDRHGDEYSRYIGELAVGTNYAARSIGSSFEDKEVYGHVHIACGSGLNALDGSWRCKYQSSLHLDGIMTEPTLAVDGTVVVERGEILVTPRPF
ncbi:aminopeptidase [Bosea sp. (in: a-proteobacteria)]|uniref:aminopeptidase n=1 Tax=Bosea sp. (in: a-proteobacteria) TaxID=1871050 RepID=UPI00261C319D|nr:aminopeptidase [Bosea sp. (in: a-proteobacteria)]MCO5091337.1 aminopeptidase [Bosea sp. (in: a-proteobacteria)]